jgi:hypothetical protein
MRTPNEMFPGRIFKGANSAIDNLLNLESCCTNGASHLVRTEKENVNADLLAHHPSRRIVSSPMWKAGSGIPRSLERLTTQ